MPKVLDQSTAQVSVTDDVTGETSTQHVVRHVTFTDALDSVHTLILFGEQELPTAERAFTHADDAVAAFFKGVL